MSSTSRDWIAAANVTAVEALKDQGWNYTVRSLYNHAKNTTRSGSPVKKFSSATSAVVSSKVREGKADTEPLRKVMYLSNWGPY